MKILPAYLAHFLWNCTGKYAKILDSTLATSHYLSRCAARQHAIIWGSVGQYPCRHMASRGGNELSSQMSWSSCPCDKQKVLQLFFRGVIQWCHNWVHLTNGTVLTWQGSRGLYDQQIFLCPFHNSQLFNTLNTWGAYIHWWPDSSFLQVMV